MVELDIHLSADRQLIVIHDDTVDRTTDGSGSVGAMSAAEIQRLDAGSWFKPEFAGERVPLLDEVLDWAGGKVGLVIELKLGPVWYPGIEEVLVSTLQQHAATREVLVISNDHQAVHRVKQLDGSIPIAIMYGARLLDPVGTARAAGADAVRPSHWMTTAEDVALCHAAGLAVIPWTVNDISSMRRVVSLGVDSMSSDYPELLGQALTEQAAR
jgi:glycerophosphoryl diester phosphodiesterase